MGQDPTKKRMHISSVIPSSTTKIVLLAFCMPPWLDVQVFIMPCIGHFVAVKLWTPLFTRWHRMTSSMSRLLLPVPQMMLFWKRLFILLRSLFPLLKLLRLADSNKPNMYKVVFYLNTTRNHLKKSKDDLSNETIFPRSFAITSKTHEDAHYKDMIRSMQAAMMIWSMATMAAPGGEGISQWTRRSWMFIWSMMNGAHW